MNMNKFINEVVGNEKHGYVSDMSREELGRMMAELNEPVFEYNPNLMVPVTLLGDMHRFAKVGDLSYWEGIDAAQLIERELSKMQYFLDTIDPDDDPNFLNKVSAKYDKFAEFARHVQQRLQAIRDNPNVYVFEGKNGKWCKADTLTKEQLEESIRYYKGHIEKLNNAINNSRKRGYTAADFKMQLAEYEMGLRAMEVRLERIKQEQDEREERRSRLRREEQTKRAAAHRLRLMAYEARLEGDKAQAGVYAHDAGKLKHEAKTIRTTLEGGE